MNWQTFFEIDHVVNVAMLMVTALVPFISVYAAQRLVRRDSLRQDAREAFLRISRDIQDYRVAFLAHYINVLHYMHLVNQSPEALQLQAARTQQLQSAHDLQRMVSTLNGDCLLLGLIFDRKADPLGSRIQQLAGTAQILFSDSEPPPPFDKCQEGLNRDIQAISDLTKPLWDALPGRPTLVRKVKWSSALQGGK